MKATLSDYMQSPRKVRLVADLVRGKSVVRSRELLTFADKKSAPALRKLLESAVSNAREKGATAENLFIKEIQVNQGLSMRRFMPQARGRANPFRLRRSTITLILDAKKAPAKSTKKTAKKASKSK